jgi:hypothetical protein
LLETTDRKRLLESNPEQGTPMTTPDNQCIYLDDLSKRWQKSADQIVEMAIDGKVALWIQFSNVFLQKAGKEGSKRKPTPPQLQERAEVRPHTEVLMQVQGRCDRTLIVAELLCLDAGNKAVVISNAVGEEWGETSMIGLKPGSLFARLDEIVQIERRQGIGPQSTGPQTSERQAQDDTTAANLADHPCFAPELHIAGQCWSALFSQAATSDCGIGKANILAWLREQHPELSKASTERIALIVTPAKSGRR